MDREAIKALATVCEARAASWFTKAYDHMTETALDINAIEQGLKLYGLAGQLRAIAENKA